MRAPKLLIKATLVVTALGVGHDIAANADVINADDNDHTVPHVYAVASTNSSYTDTVYISHTVTGDDVRVPPQRPGTLHVYHTPKTRA